MGITCSKCGKIKMKTDFRYSERQKENPTCINCHPDFKLYCKHGFKQKRVVKKCINCNEEFYSINDLRMCTSCKNKLKQTYFDC